MSGASMIGADVAALRDMALVFERAADDILQAGGRISGLVTDTGRWRGDDYGQFEQEWSGTGTRALQACATGLQNAAKLLRSNADEQERTSESVGSPGVLGIGGGGGGSWSSSSPSLQDVNRALNSSMFPVINLSLADVQGFVGPPGTSEALTAVDFAATLTDPTLSDQERGLHLTALGLDTAGSTAFEAGMRSHNPALALGGMAAMSASLAVDAAAQTDFSAEGFNTVSQYVSEHPEVILEEGAKATAQVAFDFGKKLLGSIFK